MEWGTRVEERRGDIGAASHERNGRETDSHFVVPALRVRHRPEIVSGRTSDWRTVGRPVVASIWYRMSRAAEASSCGQDFASIRFFFPEI